MTKSLSKKIILVAIVVFFIGAIVAPNTSSNVITNDDGVLSEIDGIEDKILVVNRYIGNRHVAYWEHVVDDVYVVNDFILLHQDVSSDEILKYDKCWTDIEIPSDIDIGVFEPENVFWKKMIVFPDETDQSFFYDIYGSFEFPLICWEVRHTDGTTILYDLDGDEIGCGIPAPWKGFSMSGFHEVGYEDPWLSWRQNADSWYNNWCDSTISVSFPTPATISSIISNTDYELFYEIAHGGSNYFKATETEWYYASDVTTAIMDRDPMRYVFIGSCGGLDDTGPGTWSYEFRKGENVDTVCVGYTGMGSCPGWSVSLPWQDMMFYIMDSGYTIKEAFDLACAEYPTIAPCVVFTGDENLKIREDPEEDPEDPPIIPPTVFITYPVTGDTVNNTINFTGTAQHIAGTVKYVYVKIGHRDWERAEGKEDWSFIWDTTTFPDGEVLLQAVSIDTHGVQSGVRFARVIVKNTEDPEEPKVPDLNAEGTLSWSDVKPETTVSGSFTVENVGEPESQLDWEITEYPDWGTWTLDPLIGSGLTPEQGKITVNAQIVAPNEHEQTYSGKVKIVNKLDTSDDSTIQVSLGTSTKGKSVNTLLLRFFENHPRLFSLLKLLCV